MTHIRAVSSLMKHVNMTGHNSKVLSNIHPYNLTGPQTELKVSRTNHRLLQGVNIDISNCSKAQAFVQILQF